MSSLQVSRHRRSATSRHPTQDVEDTDAIDGDEGGEVGGDVDPLQGASRWIEGLQGLACLHVPPLRNRQEDEHQKKVTILSTQTSLRPSLVEGDKQEVKRKTSRGLIMRRKTLFGEI